MATTVAKKTSSDGKYTVWIEYSYTQSTTGNYSTVTATGYIKRSDGYQSSAWNGSKNGYIEIAGQRFNGPEGIDTRNGKEAKLGSGSKKITHDSETGQATCSFKVYCPPLGGSFTYSITGTETETLKTIPRKPTLTSTDITAAYKGTFHLYWKSSMSASYIRYSTTSTFSKYKDVAVSGTSGTESITIDPTTGDWFDSGSRYSIYVKVKASASGLWSDAKSAGSATTAKFSASHTVTPQPDNAKVTVSYDIIPSAISSWDSLKLNHSYGSISLTSADSTVSYTFQKKDATHTYSFYGVRNDVKSGSTNGVDSSDYTVKAPTVLASDIATDDINSTTDSYQYVNHTTKKITSTEKSGYSKCKCCYISVPGGVTGTFDFTITCNGKTAISEKGINSSYFYTNEDTGRDVFLILFEDSERFNPIGDEYSTLRDMLQNEYPGTKGNLVISVKQFGVTTTRNIYYQFICNPPVFPDSSSVSVEETNVSILNKNLQAVTKKTANSTQLNDGTPLSTEIHFIYGHSQIKISGIPAQNTIFDAENLNRISNRTVSLGGKTKTVPLGDTSVTFTSSDITKDGLKSGKMVLTLTAQRNGDTISKEFLIPTTWYNSAVMGGFSLERENTIGEKVSYKIGGTSATRCSVWRGTFPSGIKNNARILYRFTKNGVAMPQIYQQAFFMNEDFLTTSNTSGNLVAYPAGTIVPTDPELGGLVATISMTGNLPAENPIALSDFCIIGEDLPGDTEFGFNPNNAYRVEFYIEDLLSHTSAVYDLYKGLGSLELKDTKVTTHVPFEVDPDGSDVPKYVFNENSADFYKPIVVKDFLTVDNEKAIFFRDTTNTSRKLLWVSPTSNNFVVGDAFNELPGNTHLMANQNYAIRNIIGSSTKTILDKDKLTVFSPTEFKDTIGIESNIPIKFKDSVGNYNNLLFISSYDNFVIGDASGSFPGNTHLYAGENHDLNIYIGNTIKATINKNGFDFKAPCQIPLKSLYTGSAGAGAKIVVPDTDKYSLFRINFSGQATVVLGIKNSSYIRGIGGYTTDATELWSFGFGASFSGNTWTIVSTARMAHSESGSHGVRTDNIVTSISGII